MAKNAVEAEATGDDTITVEWRDAVLAVPASLDDCPIAAIEAMELGKAAGFLAHVLGEQYDELKASGLLKTKRDLDDLGDTVLAPLGLRRSGK